MSDTSEIQTRYRTFARYEAAGNSPVYEDFANAVADDATVLDFLTQLPREKQQTNLLFAAVRAHCGVATDGAEFCRLVKDNESAIRSTMMSRATQTNEPARCAVLLPVLARLPQPLALLEVGASAGLCLYPDRYRYAYGDHRVGPAPDAEVAPSFVCEVSPNTPLPDRLPTIAWRAGIDVNPIRVDNRDDIAWLEHLIWPEQTHRLENFQRAVAVAREDPPNLVTGDLLDALPDLAGKAPDDATLVVFHSAVLAYLPDREERNRFVTAVLELGATWISNEHPRVLPQLAAQLPFEAPEDQFLLALDGRPVASTGPHGQSVDWFETEG